MRLIAFVIAVAGGFLLNETLLPDVTLPNQLLAIFGWGAVLCVAPAGAVDARTLRTVAPLLLAIALVAAGCLVSMAVGGMPRTPGLPQLGLLAMAAALVLHGARTAPLSPTLFKPFALALVIGAALGSVIAVLQMFAPELLDNHVAAFVKYRGRAVGNIGQSNLFGSTQVLGLLGLVALYALAPARRRVWDVVAALTGLLLLLGVALSGSRTGLAALALMAVWGLLDRRLALPARIALVVSPLLAFGDVYLAQALTGADLTMRESGNFTSLRTFMWRDALHLIGMQPWTGVGWGQFNFAWTLTPIPDRPSGVLEHAHNLALQLAVELGVPVAALILGLLTWGLWRAARRVAGMAGPAGASARCALMIVVVIGLHSMLEYPLWYAFFLLPTAWAWGFALGSADDSFPEPAPGAVDEAAMRARRAWRLAGALFIICATGAWFDYRTIADLYMPGPATTSLNDRLARAQASPLFRHHGQYALALQVERPADVLPEIQGAARAKLDGRLLFAWASALEATGQDDKARYVAARLREFDLPGAAPFFAVCADAAVSPKPYQCLPPSPGLTWRDLRP